jgi:mono/diheme cytochrome c family protein
MPSKVVCRTLPIVLAFIFVSIGRSDPVLAEGETFLPEAVQAGSKLFAQRCAICHGQNMRNPDTEVGAFDLRYFPRDEHDRFVRSVMGGKNAMPAWRDLISPAEIEALWAYVCAGER